MRRIDEMRSGKQIRRSGEVAAPSRRRRGRHHSSMQSSRVRRPGRLACTRTRHVAGLVLVLPHLGMGGGDVLPAEHFRHAGIDAAFDHQVIGLARLQQIGEVAALDALLAHPDEARVEGEVVAGGAGAEHDHAAALHDEAGDREGLLARMLEDEIDIDALAGDVPDRLAEGAAFLHVVVIAGGVVDIGAAGPSSRNRCG